MNFEDTEGSDEAPVPDCAGALHHSSTLSLNCPVKSRPLVKVHPGEVKLSQVACVVHMIQKRVYIIRQANTCNRKYNKYVNIQCMTIS